MPSSIRRLTLLDHQRLDRLLRRACASGPSQQRWLAETVDLLRAHRAAERDQVLGHLGAEVPELAEAAERQAIADEGLDRLADELAALVQVGAAQPAGLERLRKVCEHARTRLQEHDRTWTQRLMAPLESLVPRVELRRLGGAYEQSRDAALAGPAAGQVPPRRLDVSRAELYEIARRAGIAGRSAMTRGELIEELLRRGG